MSVYVDDMRAPYGRMIMCHMVADSLDELHAMADRIGVARKWFQGDHYDIALSKRAIAIAAGAIEVGYWDGDTVAVLVRAGLRKSIGETPRAGPCPTPYVGGTCGCGEQHDTIELQRKRLYQPELL
jgi:hypothetical protein